MWGRFLKGDIMKIEEMTSKQISDELSSHGVTMHFNSKREKLEEALRATDNVDVAVAEPEINPNVVFLTEQELIDNDFKFILCSCFTHYWFFTFTSLFAFFTITGFLLVTSFAINK